jgi:hypothetical protein
MVIESVLIKGVLLPKPETLRASPVESQSYNFDDKIRISDKIMQPSEIISSTISAD